MKPSTSRNLVPTLGALAAGILLFGATASAQDTYEWNSTTDGNTLQWDDTSILWEDLGPTPQDPAASPPGNLLNTLGAIDDTVIVRNTRGPAQATEQIRLTVDAGAIGSLFIGGYKDATAAGAAIAPPATGNWVTQLDLRTDGTLAVTNDVTLGEVDVDRERGGQLLLLTGNPASINIGGNVVSGSADPNNRIIVRGGGTGGLSLAGNIDTGSTGGSATGTREIDLRIEANVDANPSKLSLTTGSQVLSVDDFWVGERFNANANGAFTLTAGNTVEANLVRIGSTAGNAGNGPARTATGTLTIDASSSVDAFGTNGENGNIQIGAALGNYDDTQTVDGTVTVTNGRIGASNALQMGLITQNAAATGPNVSAGTLNLDAVGVTHLIGRVDDANNLAGNVTIGREGAGSVLNINEGTLHVYGSTYTGGDQSDGRDRNSEGTINVGPNGTLLVKDVDPSSALVLTIDGTTARDQNVAIGGGNLEIGRDGSGTLNVDGGTVIIGQSNLVLGQNQFNITNFVDGNMDGTTDDLLGVANFDLRDRTGALLFSDNPADGDIESNGTPDADGAINYVLTAQGLTKVLDNVSRGTVNLTNGATMIIGGGDGLGGGAFYGTTAGNPDSTPDSDLNFNNGGGDMIVDGSTLDVADNISMGTVGPNNARNSLTIRNNSTVTIGTRSDNPDPSVGRDLAGQASDITIVGANTIEIEDDLLLNGATDLTFDFGGSFVDDFGLFAFDTASLNNAELFIDGTDALATATQNVILFASGATTGFFSNVSEGQFIANGLNGTYRFSYEVGGAPNTIGLEFTATIQPDKYVWVGDGAGGNNLSWTDSGFWEDSTMNPQSNPPGGNFGTTLDRVMIMNSRAGAGNEQVRINGVDVGTVAELMIGGGTQNTQLQVRGNSGDITIGELTLGEGGVGGVIGQLFVNNAGSSATVTGDVIAGSDAGGNRILVGNNVAGGLTLNGISGAATYNADMDNREIDLFIQADDDTNTTRVDLGTGNFYSLDELRVGSIFNGPASGATQIASFTLNDSNMVEANFTRVPSAEGNTANTNTPSVDGTLTVTNATLDNPGTNGQNGNVQIGWMVANKPEGGSATGTVNAGAASLVTATNVLQLGNVGTGANLVAGDAGDLSMPNPAATADGTLNVNAADAIMTIGRITPGGTMAGGFNVGQARAGTGTINLSDGTLNSFGRIYLGGDSNQGSDRFTTGTLNITGGTLNHGADPNFTTNGGSAGLNGEVDVFGNPRNPVAIGNVNLEVGRDGTGAINQSDGTLNIFRGNLVLGQDGAGAINGVFDGNGDTTLDDLVGAADYDVRDERNQFLFSTNPLDGDIVDNGTPDADGAINYVLTAQGLTKVFPNVSRGSIDLSGGVLNVGSTQGGDPDTGTELFNDLNYNGGGGSIAISGGTMNVERNVNMGAVDTGQPRNSLTVSGTGALSIGFGASGNLNGQASDITIVGGGTNVDMSGNLNINAGTDLTFDFEGGAVTDFNFDVTGDAILGGAELFFLNDAALSGPTFGNILLIDAASNLGTTVFSNVTEGQVFGAYTFTYALGGVAGQIGLTDGTVIADTDGDGIDDVVEAAFDTDPNDPLSGHDGMPFVVNNGGTVLLRWRQLNTPGATTYTPEQSIDVGDAVAWATIPGVPAASLDQSAAGPNSTVFELQITSGLPENFGRVRIGP